MKVANPPLLAAGLSGAIAVAAGAYGYHDLAADETTRDVFMIGVQYHAWHALALLATAWLAEHRGGARRRWALIAAAAFVIGTVLFSGTIYVFAMSGDIPVPGAAPAGGAAFMLGWLIFAVLACIGTGKGSPSQ